MQHIFSRSKAGTPKERTRNLGSLFLGSATAGPVWLEALDTAEHLGLKQGHENKAAAGRRELRVAGRTGPNFPLG
jgi:hypothetical protein